jgi:hypothetical protein
VKISMVVLSSLWRSAGFGEIRTTKRASIAVAPRQKNNESKVLTTTCCEHLSATIPIILQDHSNVKQRKVRAIDDVATDELMVDEDVRCTFQSTRLLNE